MTVSITDFRNGKLSRAKSAELKESMAAMKLCKFVNRHDRVVLDKQSIIVSWKFYPGTPDVWYLSNGDPGYPGDPAEAEIKSVINLKTLIPENWEDWDDDKMIRLENVLFAIPEKIFEED